MYAEWETSANQKLEALLKKEASEMDNGAYFEALGNALWALNREPEAIWAYEKALTLSPWNTPARDALTTLQQRLSLPHETSFSFPLPLLYPTASLSFILLILLWRFNKLRLTTALAFTFCPLAIAISLWILPLHAIVLHSTSLVQAPAQNAPLVASDPLVPGLKIEVLDIEAEGTWLKVKDPKGNIGFVPFETLRVL